MSPKWYTMRKWVKTCGCALIRNHHNYIPGAGHWIGLQTRSPLRRCAAQYTHEYSTCMSDEAPKPRHLLFLYSYLSPCSVSPSYDNKPHRDAVPPECRERFEPVAGHFFSCGADAKPLSNFQSLGSRTQRSSVRQMAMAIAFAITLRDIHP